MEQWKQVPENATEPMQNAMQRSVMLRKSMNDVWRAGLAEVADQPPAAGWQPIETAPKDGSYILVCNRVGSWIAHWMPIAVSGYRFDQPWRSCMLNCWHMVEPERYDPPTHWMPLPAPPVSA